MAVRGRATGDDHSPRFISMRSWLHTHPLPAPHTPAPRRRAAAELSQRRAGDRRGSCWRPGLDVSGARASQATAWRQASMMCNYEPDRTAAAFGHQTVSAPYSGRHSSRLPLHLSDDRQSDHGRDAYRAIAAENRAARSLAERFAVGRAGLCREESIPSSLKPITRLREMLSV